jgi:hypothetical protein
MNDRARRNRSYALRAVGGSLCALGMLVLGSPAWAGDFSIIAQSGQASPDNNGTLVTFTAPALSDAGQVAFLSLLTGTDGEVDDNIALYRGTTGGLTVVARRGVTEVDMHLLDSFVGGNPAITASGTVSNSALFPTDPPPDPPPSETIAFLGNGGPLTLLPRIGTSTPEEDNKLASRSIPVLNNAGVTAYRANYTGVDFQTGIYSRAADGTVTTRLLEQASAPGGGTILSLSGSLPTLNESAQIAVTASVDDGVFTHKAALRLDGTTVVELARDGSAATNESTTINNIVSNALPLNNAGQIAFAATYTQPASSGQGIFLADDAGATLIAPSLLPDATGAATNIRLAAVNNAGKVAFSTEFAGSGDLGSGIYLADVDAATPIALEDTEIPGGGKFFSRFLGESVSLNNAGQLAFVAELSDTVDGPVAGRGLYLYSALSGLQQIIRTGDPFAGGTLLSLSFTGANYSTAASPDPNFSGLNSAGQLAFNFAIAGTSGVAIWSDSVVPLLGDYNHNGTVDAADYTVWRNSLGQVGSGLDADGNGNDEIDEGDYEIWKMHFGESSGAGAITSAHAAVPEPMAAVLIACGILGISCGRRSGRR